MTGSGNHIVRAKIYILSQLFPKILHQFEAYMIYIIAVFRNFIQDNLPRIFIPFKILFNIEIIILQGPSF